MLIISLIIVAYVVIGYTVGVLWCNDTNKKYAAELVEYDNGKRLFKHDFGEGYTEMRDHPQKPNDIVGVWPGILWPFVALIGAAATIFSVLNYLWKFMPFKPTPPEKYKAKFAKEAEAKKALEQQQQELEDFRREFEAEHDKKLNKDVLDDLLEYLSGLEHNNVTK